MSRRHVVIVGAGPVGLATAALLADALPGQLKITVVDGAPMRSWQPDDVDLRVYSIAPAAAAVLQRAGAWPQILAQRACAFERMQIWEGDGGPTADALCFDSADIGRPELGHIVEDALICHSLREQLAQHADIELRFDTRIDSFAFDARRVRIQPHGDAPALHADLLIGADGGRSAVREALNIGLLERDYAQRAIVGHLLAERPHQRTARQRFLSGGPLALLPLADGRCSFVWSLPEHRAEALMKLSDAQFSREISLASGGVLGALQLNSKRAGLPLTARLVSEYCRPRCVLVGDAAHSVHPLAGQGVNLGLADADILVRELGAAVGAGQDPGDLRVLRRYERARKAPNAAMLGMLDGLDRLFRAPAVLAPLRIAGLRAVNRIGLLKRAFIREANG